MDGGERIMHNTALVGYTFAYGLRELFYDIWSWGINGLRSTDSCISLMDWRLTFGA